MNYLDRDSFSRINKADRDGESDIPDALFIRPVFAGHQYDDPDICCVKRKIGEFELIYFVGGMGQVTINETDYDCAPGDIVLICPFEEHSIISSKTHPHDNFWVHFDVSPAFLHNDFANYLFPEGIRKRYIGLHDELISLYSTLLKEIREKRPGHAMMFDCIFSAIIVSMIRLLNDAGSEKSRSSQNSINRDAKMLSQAESFIMEKFNDPLTVDDIASELSVSKSYLFRLFKDYLKISPIRYLSMVRLKKASYMIMNTSYSLKEIAAKTGYSDQFYFSRAFRKMYGINPREYSRHIGY